MNLGELGEFAVIARMAAHLHDISSDGSGIVGVGDDTAVIPARGGKSLLFTIDTMVEGVHFLADTPAEYAGFKVVAANASDIAAMGGVPSGALVSVVCPRATKVEWLDALYGGIDEATDSFKAPILGGDTSAGEKIVLSVTMLGACDPPAPVLRSGAQPGDFVCVTGSLGGAVGGLRILGIERVLKQPEQDYGHAGLRLLERHLKPKAQLAAGRALAQAGATAMIDISDGLVADLGHICEQSRFAMTIDALAVPVNSDLLEVADRVVHDVTVAALTGGEEFELAATVPPEKFDDAVAAVEAAGTKLTKVGVVDERLAEEKPVRIMSEGEEITISRAGWVHFGEEDEPTG